MKNAIEAEESRSFGDRNGRGKMYGSKREKQQLRRSTMANDIFIYICIYKKKERDEEAEREREREGLRFER